MKTKTRFHKLTAWLLTVAMLMTLVPGFTLSASAAECLGEGTASLYAVDFNLHIGGVQVNSTNMDDITTAINEELGEEVATGSASYDMFTNTLTLNGFSYMGEGDGTAAITHSGIGGGLNIHLKGANSVRLTDTKGVAIYSGDGENGISITAESGASLELSGMYGPCSGNLNHLGEGLKMWDRKGEEIGDDGDYTTDTYLYIAAEFKEEVAEYDLSIGGVSFTDAELCVDDGNGFDTGDGYAAFDPRTNTLTLKDYDLDFDEGEKAIFYKGTDTLNIRLIGENSVTNTNTGTTSDGLYAMDSLTISGDGSLEVTGGYYGVFAHGDIEISGGEVGATGGAYGVHAGGGITITGGEVYATGGVYGVYTNGDITISGGTVEASATATDGEGLSAMGNINITGGTVEAQGDNFGVCAGDSIKISGGMTEASGGTSAFSAAPTIADGWAAYDDNNATIGPDADWANLNVVTVKQNMDSAYPISVGDEYFVLTGVDGDGNPTFNTIKGGDGTATLTVKDEYTAAPVYTITLNNFTYSGPAADGIPAAIYMHAAYADRMTTFNLVLVGDSKITLMPGGYAEGYGLLTHYVDLTIVSGTGSLTIVVDGTYDDSKGVYIDGGNLTMESGSLTVVAGDASFDANYPDDPNDTGVSTGVYVDRNLTMERGSITATGGEADIDSCGVYVGGNLTMNGGSVTATGGEAEDTSCGVFLESGSVTIEDGSVTATGGEAGYTSAGVYLNGDYDDAESGNLTIEGGSVTATGGNATGTEDMPGTSAGIAAVSGSVTVTDGSVSGTGGEARDTYGVADAEGAFGMASGSGGIMALKLTVDGGSVTASGGSAEGTNAMSLGITAVYDLAINGGSVSASAGSVSGTDAMSSGIYLYGTGFTMIGGTTVAQGETGALMVPFAENTINFENATVWYGASASEANGKEGKLYTEAFGDLDTLAEMNASKYVRIAESGSTPPVVTNYDVWVGGVQFTSELLTIDGDKGSATLAVDTTDPANPVYTLKLNGYEYVGAGHEGAVIYSEKPLTIELDGENRVIGYDVSAENSYGVNVTGNLTVTGEGLLTASGSKSANESCGIYATNDVVIESGEIIATGESAGISANSVQMEDGSLTATGESTGIFGAVTIKGGTITATGADCGIFEGVALLGGAVTAKGTSADGYGIIGSIGIIDGAMTATGGHSAFMFEEDRSPMLTMATSLIKAGASETDAAEITLEALESSYQHGTESYDGYVYTTHKYFSIAQDDNYYPITVGGVAVSKENMTDVLGDGGSVSYDPSTNTLTLNNATITGIENDTASMGTGILAMSDLKLKLVGENTVTGQQAMLQGIIPASYAIVVYGDLTISGGGSLVAEGNEIEAEDCTSIGIIGNNNITIESGTVTAKSGEIGINAMGSIMMSGGELKAIGKEFGINALGNITVKGGSLTATATDTDGTALSYMGTFSFEDGYTPLVYVGDSAENTAPWDEETYLKNYSYVRIYPQDSDLLEVIYMDGVEDEEIFADVTYNKLVKGVGTPAFGDANPTRAGYTFTGWSPAVADTVTKNEIYTAQWTVNQYTITFDVNGGIVAPASAIVTIPTAGTYTLIFADYEGTGLNKVDTVTFTVTEDKVGAITVPIENGITLGTGDKIMLWNNMTDLVPLCEAYIVE